MFVSDIQSWVLRKNQLSSSEFQGLTYIAAEADGHGNYYGGQAHLVKTSGMKPRTLQRVIAQLREKDLLHSERRPCPLERGRMNDVIVLHLSNSGWETPVVEDATVLNYQKQLREAYELIEELTSANSQPVDNLPKHLVANLAGRCETPSQNQDANLAGKSGSNVSTRQNVRIYPPKMVDLPANLAGKSEAALIGNARDAHAPMIDRLINPSINQSPNTSTGARDEKPRPANPPAVTDVAANFYRGVNLDQLVTAHRDSTGSDYSGLAPEILHLMVDKVLSRAKQEPAYPTVFVIRAFANGADELLSMAMGAYAERLGQAPTEQAPTPARSKPMWCEIHNREFTGQACPVCSNPRLTALEQKQAASAPSVPVNRPQGRGVRWLQEQEAHRQQTREVRPLTQPPLKQRA